MVFLSWSLERNSVSTSVAPLMTFADINVRPHSGVQARQSNAPRLADSKFPVVLVYSPLVISTLFAKVSVPPFGAQGIGITYPVLGVLLLLGIATGRVGDQSIPCSLLRNTAWTSSE